MITVKLVSLILGRPIKTAPQRFIIGNNTMTFAFQDEDMWTDLNLDTFGRLCKEWCWDKGYALESYLGCCKVIELPTNKTLKVFAANIEELPQIIKATEWVAKEKGLLND